MKVVELLFVVAFKDRQLLAEHAIPFAISRDFSLERGSRGSEL